MTPLHKVTKAYWDAFYAGMMAVGLNPKERPAFRAKGDTESETMRCMRQAMEALKEPSKEAIDAGCSAISDNGYSGANARNVTEIWQAMLAATFPEPVKARRKPLTGNDMAVKSRAKRKYG